MAASVTRPSSPAHSGGAHENLCGHNKLSYVVGRATITRTQQPRESAPSRDSAHHPSVLGNVRMSKRSDGEEGTHQTLSLCKGNRSRQSKPNQAKIQAETRETLCQTLTLASGLGNHWAISRARWEQTGFVPIAAALMPRILTCSECPNAREGVC